MRANYKIKTELASARLKCFTENTAKSRKFFKQFNIHGGHKLVNFHHIRIRVEKITEEVLAVYF